MRRRRRAREGQEKRKRENRRPILKKLCAALLRLFRGQHSEKMKGSAQGNWDRTTTLRRLLIGAAATVRIKSLSQTRWTAYADAAKVVISKQQPLTETLEAIKVNSSLSWEVKADARGLIRMLSSFPTLL